MVCRFFVLALFIRTCIFTILHTWESLLSCQLVEDHRGHVLPKIRRGVVKFTRALYFAAHSTIRLFSTFFSNTNQLNRTRTYILQFYC